MPRSKPPARSGSGSPPLGEPDYLVVGKLRRPHGLHGEMVMEIITDFPERLKRGKQVFIGEAHVPHTIASRRHHNEGLLIAFEGQSGRSDVDNLRNHLVYVTVKDLPELPENEYYHHQLIGLTVMADDDRLLGQLVDIIETGANDVYIVRDDAGGEILLPAIPPVVLDVNLDSAMMRVHLLEGLLDE